MNTERVETETAEMDTERLETETGENDTERVETETGEKDTERLETETGENMEGNRKDHEVNEESFDYFAWTQSKDLRLFLRFHPQQTPKRALPNIFYTKDGLM